MARAAAPPMRTTAGYKPITVARAAGCVNGVYCASPRGHGGHQNLAVPDQVYDTLRPGTPAGRLNSEHNVLWIHRT